MGKAKKASLIILQTLKKIQQKLQGHANGIYIGIYTQDFENEFISLTDIARYKSDEPTAVIQNWMRNRDVIDSWDYGKGYTIQILNPSNSRGLENKQGQMHLQCHLRNG